LKHDSHDKGEGSLSHRVRKANLISMSVETCLAGLGRGKHALQG